MKIQLPTALIERIDNHIKEEETFFQIKEKQRQLLNKKLINLWYFICSSQIDDNNNTLKYYTNIPRENFRIFKFKFKTKVFQYNELLNYLNKWDLIDINQKYCSKKSCNSFTKSYRINTKFLSGTHMTEVEIDFSKIFKNTNNKEYWMKKYPDHSNLIEDCYNTTINLDEFINWLYMKKGKKLKSKMINGVLTKRYLTSERIIMYINKALKLHFKNLWFAVSNEGRLYSSITNLPNDAIDYLRLYEKKVIELDVSNCQPLLLAYYINNNDYQKDVENGVFYERILHKLGWKKKKDRDKLKNLAYRYFFFSKNILKSGKIYNVINEFYPQLIEQINDLKKNYNLALKLQRMESYIFIDRIGKLPNKKITRHDSVLIFKEEEKYFKEMIENEFNNYNLKVTVKVKK